MPHLTLIVGLPGSGKSHYATTRLRDVEYFHDIRHPAYANDDSRNVHGVINWLLEGGDCVAEDVSFCVPEAREELLAEIRERVPGVEIEVIYFARSVENCLINMLGDFHTKGKSPNFFNRIHAFCHLVDRYKIPDQAAQEPVVTPYALNRTPGP